MRLHACCVSIDGKGVLIEGDSGSGKSALALNLIALGAKLVADDQVVLSCEDDRLYAQPHPNIAGLIEAHGIGILKLPYITKAPLAYIIKLSQSGDRLPKLTEVNLLSVKMPVIMARNQEDAAAILIAVRYDGLQNPDG